MLWRTTLAALTRTVGPDNENTLATESYLVKAMNSLGDYTEADALIRESFEKHQRVVGPNHQTLVVAGDLAASLKTKASTPGARRFSARSSSPRPACSAPSTEKRYLRRATWPTLLCSAANRRRRSSFSATRWLCLGARSVRVTNFPGLLEDYRAALGLSAR